MYCNYLSIDIIGGTMFNIINLIKICYGCLAIDINSKEDLVILTIGICSFVYIIIMMGYFISMGAEWLLSLI